MYRTVYSGVLAYVDTHCYQVCNYTYDIRLGYFDTKTKTAPVAGRRREHGRGLPRQSGEGKGRHDEQTIHRMVDLISS